MTHRLLHDSDDSRSSGEGLAVALGWFSLGLGLAEMLAPRQVARLIGIAPTERAVNTLRAMGAREFGTGLVILRRPDNPAGLWARVAGDAVDLSLLGSARRDSTSPGRTTVAATAVLGATALDALCAMQLSRARRGELSADAGVFVEHVVTINRPIAEVFQFWRRFDEFPRFMRHLESVEMIDGVRSHWRAKAPAGTSVEWDAEIVDERENEVIAWRSVEGSQIENRGEVRFEHAPGARGTEVRVQIEYVPPAGSVGRMIAKLFGEEPAQQLRDDLRRVKQLLETGEITLSDGPSLWRAAQPARADEVSTISGVDR
jgi:uncharacterized membrane protein